VIETKSRSREGWFQSRIPTRFAWGTTPALRATPPNSGGESPKLSPDFMCKAPNCPHDHQWNSNPCSGARTAAGKFVLNITMKELEECLDGEVFCRIHKQVIVQLSYAREVHSLAGGNYVLNLSEAPNSRSRFG